MENAPRFRPELLDLFGGQFDSDMIDLDDMEDILLRAETVALNLLAIGMTSEDISGPLRQALENLTPEITRQFSVASNGWWDYDDEVEMAFRSILERIILAANGGGTLARNVSDEEYRRMHAAGLVGQKA